MAGCKMFPDVLPDEIRNDPKRRTECAVYDALSEQLKDEKFSVFYSKDWLNTKLTDMGQEDGECDFVVAHPDLGLLCIEVKGGKVRKDGASSQWYSGRHKIKDPIRQARTSKHVIREAINDIWGQTMPFIKTVHCAVLPNSACNDSYLGEGLPLEIFAFEEDMPKLGRKIYEFYDFEAARDSRINGKLGHRGMEILEKMFAKDLDFSPKLKNRIERNTYLIKQRTEAQSKIVDALKNMDRVLIEGPAGSGKTVLAIDVAEAAAQAAEPEGENVLLVCYNAPLRKFLRGIKPDAPRNLWIHSYHSLCRQLVIDSGLMTAAQIDGNFPKFCENATEMAWEAAGRSNPSFSTVVVDEGQDFSQEWWELLQALTRDGDKAVVRVFRDNNQKVRRDGDADYKDLQGPGLLDTVVRNTRAIGESAIAFYSGENIQVDGPEGDSVCWVESGDEPKDIDDLVRRFVNYEGVKPADIAVLTLQAVENTAMKDVTKLAGFEIGRADDDGDLVTVDSVKRFKGLERNVVILCGFPESDPDDALLYVGISRAKSYLAIVGPEPAIEGTRKFIEESIKGGS